MKRIIVILVLVTLSRLVIATPDSGIVEHETLIGYSEFYYYSIKVISYPSRTHYTKLDSAFILERELESGKEKHKIFISSRFHENLSGTSDWDTKLNKNEQFNFAHFLVKKNVKYLYPIVNEHVDYRIIDFKIDFEGLKLRNEMNLLVGLSELEVFMPWIKKYLKEQKRINEYFTKTSAKEFIKVHDVVGDEKYLFLTIEGVNAPEVLHTILVLKKEDFGNLFD